MVPGAQKSSREKSIIHQSSTAGQWSLAIPEAGKAQKNTKLILFSRRPLWDMHWKSQIKPWCEFGTSWRVTSWSSVAW